MLIMSIRIQLALAATPGSIEQAAPGNVAQNGTLQILEAYTCPKETQLGQLSHTTYA
jgi:hypothetical protein